MTNKYAVGDKVRMLSKCNIFAADRTKDGEVYDITEVRADGDIVIDDKSGGCRLLITVKEQAHIELVKEDANMSEKFAMGEKLTITGTEGNAAAMAKVGGVAVITGDFDGKYYPCLYEHDMDGEADGWIAPRNLKRKNARYKTEKRKANVGERILITNAAPINEQDYEEGTVFTVTEIDVISRGDVHVQEVASYIDILEYEVIVDEPTPANEKFVLTRLFNAEAEIDELKRQVKALETVLAESSKLTPVPRMPHLAKTLNDFIVRNTHVPVTPNNQRKAVIERARAFVAEHSPIAYYRKSPLTKGVGDVRIKFVVNAEKRTVVAIPELAHVKSAVTKLEKGIAKCDPSDVFNADIGKAIALGRALGVDVSEFEQAGQPTEVVVGMKVIFQSNTGRGVLDVISDGGGSFYPDNQTKLCVAKSINNVIIDDTNAVYE